METIALVACVKSKKAGLHAAKDLYSSTLFNYSRLYAERHADQWFILSAKYGLVDPETPLQPYEETLKNAHLTRRMAWAASVYRQIVALGLDRPDVTILWLAGSDYQSPLRMMLMHCKQVDPLRGRRLGERLSWLSWNLGS